MTFHHDSKHVRELDGIREQLLALRMLFMERIPAFRASLMTNTASDNVDIGYELREIGRISDELRKDAAALQELITRLLCLASAESFNDEMAGEGSPKIVGKLAWAMMDAKVCPKMPKPGSPEMQKILQWLGVAGSEDSTNCLSLDFKSMSDLITRLAQEGRNIPEEVLQTWTKFSAVFHGKRKE